MTNPEKAMSAIFVLTLVLWMLSSTLGINATLVSFISMCLLLLCDILTPKDVLNETGAWNILI